MSVYMIGGKAGLLASGKGRDNRTNRGIRPADIFLLTAETDFALHMAVPFPPQLTNEPGQLQQIVSPKQSPACCQRDKRIGGYNICPVGW
jgi:hypothetical protein